MDPLQHQPGRRAVPPSVVLVATIAACLPLLVVAQFIAHVRVDEYDKWLFVYYGRRLLEGARLYMDIWDNKPPGIFWLNALGLKLTGGAPTGVIALCMLAGCGTVAVFFAAVRRLYGWSTAGLATVLAALYLNIAQFHVGCNRPATFLVLTELGCFALYWRAAGAVRGRFVGLMLAGACGGLGLGLHQTALAASAAAVGHQMWLMIRRRVGLGRGVANLAGFAVGWAGVVGLLVGATCLTTDPGWAWHAVVGFNRLYFLPGVGSSWWPDITWVEEHLAGLALPLILAGATLPAAAATWWAGRGRTDGAAEEPAGPPGLLLYLWVWLAVAVYLAGLGPHRRVPYLAVALPPLCVLSAHSVYLLLRSGAAGGRRMPAYHVFIAVGWFAYMLIAPVRIQLDAAARHYYHRFLAPADDAEARNLAAIRRYCRPGDAVFMFGYAPHLYWQLHVRNALRYIGTEKIGQLGAWGQPLFDETAGLLRMARPQLIVLDGVDLRRSPTVGQLRTAELQAWLETEYAHPEPEEFPHLWVRRP